MLHIWYNTGSGMYYPVFEMVHIIGSLLLSEMVADEVVESDFLSRWVVLIHMSDMI